MAVLFACYVLNALKLHHFTLQIVGIFGGLACGLLELNFFEFIQITLPLLMLVMITEEVRSQVDLEILHRMNVTFLSNHVPVTTNSSSSSGAASIVTDSERSGSHPRAETKVPVCNGGVKAAVTRDRGRRSSFFGFQHTHVTEHGGVNVQNKSDDAVVDAIVGSTSAVREQRNNNKVVATASSKTSVVSPSSSDDNVADSEHKTRSDKHNVVASGDSLSIVRSKKHTSTPTRYCEAGT